MKLFITFFITLVCLQNSYALTTIINGTTYSCEPEQKTFYCTIDSSFDGSFGGSGRTELEAKTEAKKACKLGSSRNGFFCDDRSIQCDSSN